MRLLVTVDGLPLPLLLLLLLVLLLPTALTKNGDEAKEAK